MASTDAQPHRLFIIVPAADRDRANQAAAGLSGNAADLETFDTALSASGQGPASHYCCCVAMDDAKYAAFAPLPAAFPGAVVTEYDLVAAPGRPDAVLAALGLQRVLPEWLR